MAVSNSVHYWGVWTCNLMADAFFQHFRKPGGHSFRTVFVVVPDGYFDDSRGIGYGYIVGGYDCFAVCNRGCADDEFG